MSEWWTYRPKDFLLFSPRVYWRMFELHNETLWPLQLLMAAAVVALVFCMFRRTAHNGSWIALFLAALWIFVGWSFLWNRYAIINWAIAYVAPAFVLQAILLLLAAIMPGGIIFDRRDVFGRTGLLLATAGLFLYPLLSPLFGRSWVSAETFGIAPDPTAIVTLGLLLTARGRLLRLLLPIPLLWCLLSGLTLWTMNDRQAWLPLLIVIVVLAAFSLQFVMRRPVR